VREAGADRSPAARRNQALIALIYRSGLRLREALDLAPGDLDLVVGTVRIRPGARAVAAQARTVGVDAPTARIAAGWSEERARLGLAGAPTLFCTLRGDRLGDAYIRELLPRLGRRAQIPGRVHAAGLRSTHAAELLREGFPVRALQAHLGLGSLAAAERYLAPLLPDEDPVGAVRDREWCP
jgi:site-specific recombinase XerD